jgi:hypothetical protein
MLLIDAVHGIETVGGIWLGMSAIAFFLLVVFEAIRDKSAEIDATAGNEGLILDLAPQTEIAKKTQRKRHASNKAPARKAA